MNGSTARGDSATRPPNVTPEDHRGCTDPTSTGTPRSPPGKNPTSWRTNHERDSKPTPGITPLGDNKYKVRVYDPRDGQRLVETVDGIAEARRTHARFKAEVQKVGRTPRHGRAPLVREFGESWRTPARHAPGTASGLEQ